MMRKPPLEPMKTKAEALELLFSHWTPEREIETVPIQKAIGRVLAEDATALYNVPVIRASSMDGVAIRYADVASGLPDTAAWRLGKDYVRADTGDDFDDAFDTVVRIEEVTLLPEGGLTFSPGLEIKEGMGVRPAGSTLKRGALLGKAGTVLTALDVAALGTGGLGEIPVVRKPRVAFLPTGSELVPLGHGLGRGQYFDTNSLMASQILREMGAEPISHPILRDDPAALEAALDKALAEADIVLLNAGTSKGGEDYCARLLEQRGGRLFHGVAAVPGRPMSMAVLEGKPVVNLSGPALACFYSLEWAIRPIVCRFLGIPVPERPKVEARLTAPLGCPPMFSALCMLRLNRLPDGSFEATPVSGGPGPRPGGPGGPGPQRGGPPASLAETLTARGAYITTPGEPAHVAGDTIQVTLLDSVGL